MEKVGRLKVGETVKWRGDFGTATPLDAKVKSIEICDLGSKSGRDVESVAWNTVNSRKILLTLDNDHWCYGTQVSKKQ